MAKQIMVGADGSAPAAAAVEWAAADARRRGLDVRIVRVGDPDKPCAETMNDLAARVHALAPDAGVTMEVRGGNVVEELIAASASADSLVLGSHGHGGFAGVVTGSVTMGVAGHAHVPVVVVRGPRVVEYGRVVIGYDGSDHSQAAMEYAVEQARARLAQLHVLSAWQMPVPTPYAPACDVLIEEAVRQELDTARARVEPWRESNPDLVITDDQPRDHPVPALIKASQTADLVVVGSRGRGGFASAVLGSVSHGVLHRAACPVAVVRR
ncbi:universal stress protein [Nonomuraea maritima]|uniref:universal stress protein n=1 Tax=Nonomuraea maritima TaxID=683260 RepID=UPI00371779F1